MKHTNKNNLLVAFVLILLRFMENGPSVTAVLEVTFDDWKFKRGCRKINLDEVNKVLAENVDDGVLKRVVDRVDDVNILNGF